MAPPQAPRPLRVPRNKGRELFPTAGSRVAGDVTVGRITPSSHSHAPTPSPLSPRTLSYTMPSHPISSFLLRGPRFLQAPLPPPPRGLPCWLRA